MKEYNSFRTAFKNKTKSTEDILKSQIYQAIKSISKVIKIIKTFLILKSTKKLIEFRLALDEDRNSSTIENKINNELELLEKLKSVDCKNLASTIVRLKVSFGADPNYNPSLTQNIPMIDQSLFNLFIQHKRMSDIIQELQYKITTSIESNNKKRLLLEKQITINKSNYIDGTKAVFIDTLDNKEETIDDSKSNKDFILQQTERNLKKLNKSLRNQANRMSNRLKNHNQEEVKDEKSFSNNNYNNNNKYYDNNNDYDEYSNKKNSKNDNDPNLFMYRPLDQRYSSTALISINNSNNNNKIVSLVGHSNNKDLKNKSINNYNKSKDHNIKDRQNNNNIKNNSNNINHKKEPSVITTYLKDLVKAASFGKEWQKTGVHPSWAAKQQLKQISITTNISIKNESKNKIIFDD